MDTEFLIKIARHCIGLDNSHPYVRNGKVFYKPYRNYYTTALPNSAWDELERKGYATHNEIRLSYGERASTTYYLTRAGLDWLGGVLGMTIYDEED